MFDRKKKVKKENNSGLRVIPGMCCAIDPKNELAQKENDVTHVVVIRRIKKKPFRNSIWEVRDFDSADNAPTMEIPEWRLWPENMSLVRYPDDMPTINAADMEVINHLVKAAEGDHFVLKVLLGDNGLNRLKALHAKLKYYYEMRDV